jgi:hypothetical protein
MSMQANHEAKTRSGLRPDCCFICDREAATFSQPLKWIAQGGTTAVCEYCERVLLTVTRELRHGRSTHPRGVASTQVLYLWREFILLAEELGVPAQTTARLLEAAGAFK